jgi:hypothetical protein
MLPTLRYATLSLLLRYGNVIDPPALPCCSCSKVLTVGRLRGIAFIRASSSTKDLLCFRFDSRWPTYLPVPVACDLLLSGVSLVREARRGVYVELALVRDDVDVNVDVV